MTNKNKFIHKLSDYMLLTLGTIIVAASINIFMVPYKITPGGVGGLATVVYYLSAKWIPVGASMLALNVPLFIFGLLLIGKKSIFRTLYSAVLLSVVIDFTAPMCLGFVHQYLSMPGNVQQDMLLYSVVGGFLMGLGLGIVFKNGATTGGTDLAARIVNHVKPTLTIGQNMLIIDMVVIVAATALFKSFHLGLYSAITLYVASKVADVVVDGLSFTKAVFIISEKSDTIAKRILDEVERGVTSIKGTGLYTGDSKDVLACIIHREQLHDLKRTVIEEDPEAFIVLSDIREVLGEGFKSYVDTGIK